MVHISLIIFFYTFSSGYKLLRVYYNLWENMIFSAHIYNRQLIFVCVDSLYLHLLYISSSPLVYRSGYKRYIFIYTIYKSWKSNDKNLLIFRSILLVGLLKKSSIIIDSKSTRVTTCISSEVQDIRRNWTFVVQLVI